MKVPGRRGIGSDHLKEQLGYRYMESSGRGDEAYCRYPLVHEHYIAR